jgi:3-methylcrotonyl-CoA carboxylase alpha subunit
MNTRLQVEHPVTEMVTGLDLVEWQLRIAAGEKLPLSQHEIRLNGHAIEARIYAEDPARDFAPSTGRLALLRTPQQTQSVRIDTGFRTGDTVPVHYDAMLAKLICHGATREEARQLLVRALAEMDVAGVVSNLDMLHRITVHPEFAKGGIDTGFIARNAQMLLAPQTTPPDEVLAAAALSILLEEKELAERTAKASGDPFSPWHTRDGWWLNASSRRTLPFLAGETPYPVGLSRERDAWVLDVGKRTYRGDAAREPDGHTRIVLDRARRRASVVHDGQTLSVRHDGETWRLRLPDPIAQAEEALTEGDQLLAPIPGQVTQVLAEPGMTVERGQVLVVLEAMKTVFRLSASAAGVVAAVACAAGDMVQEGQLLVGFETEDPAGNSVGC